MLAAISSSDWFTILSTTISSDLHIAFQLHVVFNIWKRKTQTTKHKKTYSCYICEFLSRWTSEQVNQSSFYKSSPLNDQCIKLLALFFFSLKFNYKKINFSFSAHIWGILYTNLNWKVTNILIFQSSHYALWMKRRARGSSLHWTALNWISMNK